MATALEIAGLDTEELASRLDETRRELFNLRFQLATGQLDDPSRLKLAKKDIARLLTELRAREIAEAEGLEIEQLPAQRAAARQARADEAAGLVRTSSDERRAARRAEKEAERAAMAEHDHEAEGDHDHDHDHDHEAEGDEDTEDTEEES